MPYGVLGRAAVCYPAISGNDDSAQSQGELHHVITAPAIGITAFGMGVVSIAIGGSLLLVIINVVSSSYGEHISRDDYRAKA